MFGKTWCVGEGMKEFVGGCSSLVPLFVGGKDSTLPFPIASLLTHPPTKTIRFFTAREKKEEHPKSQYNTQE